MKYSLLLLFVLTTYSFAKAQFTEPNQKIVGGAFSLNAGNSTTTNSPGAELKSTSFVFSASYGKFVKKNWLSSFGIFYVHSNSKNISPTNSATNPVNNFSAFYSKTYFKSIAKKLYFGIGGSATIGYGTAIVKETASTSNSKSQSLQASVGLFPLLSYQLTERFVVNLSPANHFLFLGYSYNTIKNMPANQPATTGKSQSLNIDGGFWASPLSNLSVGFSYLLKHNK